tara:strand:+ start:691 stop:1323 length:633 start_codon:yes stop_codon:yes gene_type:complete
MKNRSKVKHPWRKCPLGEHWVSEHPREVPVSEKNPDGITIVDGHCRKNPSRHEIFVADEIHDISTQYFKNLKNKPTADTLGFPQGNQYDDLIGGWTQFWNEILKPEIPLDPNLIKALIASESGFNLEAKAESKIGVAKGLIQITEQTRKILADQSGELSDFLITLSKKEVSDPNLNLSAGIRWLFHKKHLASHRLKRTATWLEAIAERAS